MVFALLKRIQASATGKDFQKLMRTTRLDIPQGEPCLPKERGIVAIFSQHKNFRHFFSHFLRCAFFRSNLLLPNQTGATEMLIENKLKHRKETNEIWLYKFAPPICRLLHFILFVKLFSSVCKMATAPRCSCTRSFRLA